MDVDQITPLLLNQTLRAWRQGLETPAELLALDLLQSDPGATAIERTIDLQDTIQRLAVGELNRQRAAEDLLPLPQTAVSRKDLLSGLSRDFATGNAELQAWSALYHRYLCPVPLGVEDLSGAIPTDPRHFRRRLDLGVRRLAELLQRAELAAHQHRAALGRVRHLPNPEYDTLFGVSALQQQLSAMMRDPAGPNFLSIEGLGGIGKTALARAVAFDLAQESNYEGIAWISARQAWLTDSGAIATTANAVTSLTDIVSRLTAQLGLDHLAGLGTDEKLAYLQTFLAQQRYLVVIDNLESISDINALMPAIAPLAGHSRFLLTSRQALSNYNHVHRRQVPQLAPADSLALFKAELARHGLPQTMSAADIEALNHLVGGIPLALKLVAAQAGRWPLPVILRDMATANRSAPERLYTFIYQRTWLALHDDARRLLLSMLTISPDGEDVDWLRLFSALEADAFDNALRQLQEYSLLETAGSLSGPSYRLHRLTITFLQTEVIAGWDNSSDNTFMPADGNEDSTA